MFPTNRMLFTSIFPIPPFFRCSSSAFENKSERSEQSGARVSDGSQKIFRLPSKIFLTTVESFFDCSGKPFARLHRSRMAARIFPRMGKKVV